MKLAIPIVFLAIVALFYFAAAPGSLNATHLKQIVELEGDGNPRHLTCKSKAKCLVIYLSPWCAACKTFDQFILPYLPEQMRELSKDAGMSLVIGRDNRGNINFFGANTKLPFLPDESGEIYKALKTRAVPTFFLIDENGKIIRQKVGFSSPGQTPIEMTQNFIKMFING